MFVCAAWFWFSLHPGSLLGLAVTGGDWMRLLRSLDSKQLQTRSALRAAGRRSIATHFILGGFGITAGVAVGNYTLTAIGPGLLSAIVGFAIGYLSLLWSTRPGG
jgi:hypothetical protein